MFPMSPSDAGVQLGSRWLTWTTSHRPPSMAEYYGLSPEALNHTNNGSNKDRCGDNNSCAKNSKLNTRLSFKRQHLHFPQVWRSIQSKQNMSTGWCNSPGLVTIITHIITANVMNTCWYQTEEPQGEEFTGKFAWSPGFRFMYGESELILKPAQDDYDCFVSSITVSWNLASVCVVSRVVLARNRENN